MNDGKKIFKASIESFLSKSSFYIISKVNDDYVFKIDIFNMDEDDEDGEVVNSLIVHDENFYDDFIANLRDMTKDWNDEPYNDFSVLDGTQWSIMIDSKIKFSGSNDFPSNFDDVMKYIDEQFKKQ